MKNHYPLVISYYTATKTSKYIHWWALLYPVDRVVQFLKNFFKSWVHELYSYDLENKTTTRAYTLTDQGPVKFDHPNIEGWTAAVHIDMEEPE